MINFIGVGAQKSATSWVYACLYEHPEVCIPIKELHFFSRERFSKGKEWYERHFKKCGDKKTGEFSTSYLYSLEAAQRIATMYPEVRLIAILRNPTERAHSQYRNAIKAGEITEEMSFDTYATDESSCLEQGKYHEQLLRYWNVFKKEQLLILIQEDIEKDKLAFIHSIYTHIGVDSSFVPPSLNERINVARTPKAVGVDTGMHRIAEWLRLSGLDAFVHMIRRTGVPDFIRSLNTKKEKKETQVGTYLSTYQSTYQNVFKEDITQLSELLGRDMNKEWKL